MTEAEAFESIGREHVKAVMFESAHARVLDALAKVVSGEIDRSRVMVNLTDKSAIWAPEGFRPEMPATINGLPVCVVAGEDKAAATIEVQRQIIEKLEAEIKQFKASTVCPHCGQVGGGHSANCVDNVL